jgi:hypothetical protein
MRLFAEALVSAIIAVFVLNFFGLTLYTMTSLTSFFVILLIIVAIEEKTGISNRRVLRQMRLERPIYSTIIAFIMLLLIALVFSVIHDRVSIIVTPLINTTEETGLFGLAFVLALAYRGFYHVLFKGIELDTGIDLGIKKRFSEAPQMIAKKMAPEAKGKAKPKAKPKQERELDIQKTVEE